MKRMVWKQRVLVRMVEMAGNAVALPADVPGFANRPRRCDTGWWVTLDRRIDGPCVHPFPEDDHRGKDVLTYPEWCEMENP